jgi:hypothetical protein
MEEEKAKVREKKTKKVKNSNDNEAVNGLSLEGSKLSGTKHDLTVEKASAKVDKNGKVANGNKNVNGGAAAAKRFKATDIAPANATEVYASIFTSSRKSEFKETYSCRSLPLGRN